MPGCGHAAFLLPVERAFVASLLRPNGAVLAEAVGHRPLLRVCHPSLHGRNPRPGGKGTLVPGGRKSAPLRLSSRRGVVYFRAGGRKGLFQRAALLALEEITRSAGKRLRKHAVTLR